MSFISVSPGQTIRATHVQQFTNWLTAQKLDTPVHVAATSSTEYVMTVRSQETGTGLAMVLQYGPVSTPTTLAYFSKDANRIQSNSGSNALHVNNTAVGITGTLLLNGVALTSADGLLPVFNVENYGVTMDVTSASVRATNAVMLEALATIMATTSTGGYAYIPSGSLHTDDFDWDHHAGFSVPNWLGGAPGSSYIKLYGTGPSGAFIDVASDATSAVGRGGFENLIIFNQEIPGAATPTIRLRYVDGFQFNNVYILNGGAGKAPVVGVQMTGAASGVRFSRSKIQTRDDFVALTAAALTPIAWDLATSSGAAGLFMDHSDLSGCAGRSRGIRFNNDGIFDTIDLDHVTVKDHEIGIGTFLAACRPVNITMTAGFIDGCGKDIEFAPVASGAVIGFAANGVWMSATSNNVVLSTENGGDIQRTSIIGGYMLNASASAMLIQGGVESLQVKDVIIRTSADTTATYGMLTTLVGTVAATRLAISGNEVIMKTAATASISIHTSVESVVVLGNISIGKDIQFFGATSASRQWSTSTNIFNAAGAL